MRYNWSTCCLLVTEGPAANDVTNNDNDGSEMSTRLISNI